MALEPSLLFLRFDTNVLGAECAYSRGADLLWIPTPLQYRMVYDRHLDHNLKVLVQARSEPDSRVHATLHGNFILTLNFRRSHQAWKRAGIKTLSYFAA